MINNNLCEKLKTLPKNPGVYFHKNLKNEVIYVGKASNLKNRVMSYFRGEHDIKTEALIREIFTTDWIETDSEIDALFLESEMIKRYMPQYNIELRDDKSSVFVKIDFRENVPTVTTSRNPIDDGADYIGPFYSAAALKLSLRYLKRVFPFFAKKQDVYSKLPTQLGLVPDIFTYNPETKTREINHEKVAEYKKNLRVLVRYLRGDRKKIQIDLEREMKRLAKNENFEDAAKIRNQLRYLNELRKQTVFGREEFMDASKDQALIGLKDLLNLPEIPRRIEAFDISHISGTNVVASMVVATNGIMDRREYRKFKLRNQKNDDTGALREIIERRFSSRNSSWARPDLIILDGGKAQISAVTELLSKQKIAFIGRDKSGNHGGNSEVKIQFLKNGSFHEINFGKSSHIAMLIARLDEEAHRFAVTYHQNLREKSMIKNALEEIPGIGPATRKKLLSEFGSVKKIRENISSDYENFEKIVGEKIAKNLRENL